MVVMMMMPMCIRSEYLLIKVNLFCTRYIKLLFIFINFMDLFSLIYKMQFKHFGDPGASNTCTCFFAT